MTAALPAQLLVAALRAAEAAGGELLRRFGAAAGVGTKSSATDPVSDADRASESLLVDALLAARPDDGILGEEGTQRPGNSGLRWVIDPLDGTVNYLYGYPGWSVSIACEDLGGALVGVVHDPLRGETFSATRGGGAWWRGQRVTVNNPVPLEQALVATGFSYRPDHRRRQARIVADLLPRVRDVRRGGSCALDLCGVAAGRVDGYYEDTTSRWDWLAGALIAVEAGAVVGELPLVNGGSGVVAAGAALYEPLRALVTAPGG